MRYAYLRWAVAASSKYRRHKKPIKCLADALMHPLAFDLQDATALPDDEAAWLAGLTVAMQHTHPGLFDAHGFDSFIYAWATTAPNLRGSNKVDINERRFVRWLKAAPRSADDAENWYQYSIEALKVVRGLLFDPRTLYDIAAMRADGELPEHGPGSFTGRCALEFYNHQRTGRDGKQPPMKTIQSILGNARE